MQNVMTVNDIYTAALALLGEFPEQDSESVTVMISLLNTLIADCFDINNTLRIYKGKEKLDDIPFIESLDDEVVYEPELCRDGLVYGLASLLILEDDTDRASFFDFRYQQKKLQYNKMENIDSGEFTV